MGSRTWTLLPSGGEIRRAGNMDSLASATLLKADGSTVEATTALQGKELVLYYFSAHWCPPCRRFTPMLAEFYKAASQLGVEIVFVSADQSEDAMFSYMKESHGDWLAVSHNSDLAEELNKKFKVEGIPTLVVVTKEGKLLTDEGDKQVTSLKPAEAVDAWKAMADKS